MTSYLQSLAVTADLYHPMVCVRNLRVSGLGPMDEGCSEVVNHLSGHLRPDINSTGKGLQTGRDAAYSWNSQLLLDLSSWPSGLCSQAATQHSNWFLPRQATGESEKELYSRSPTCVTYWGSYISLFCWWWWWCFVLFLRRVIRSPCLEGIPPSIVYCRFLTKR